MSKISYVLIEWKSSATLNVEDVDVISAGWFRPSGFTGNFSRAPPAFVERWAQPLLHASLCINIDLACSSSLYPSRTALRSRYIQWNVENPCRPLFWLPTWTGDDPFLSNSSLAFFWLGAITFCGPSPIPPLSYKNCLPNLRPQITPTSRSFHAISLTFPWYSTLARGCNKMISGFTAFSTDDRVRYESNKPPATRMR